jgi:hypothetical protein
MAGNGEARRRLLFRRFRAPFDEPEAQGGSTEHDELTSGEIRAEDGPQMARDLGWWLARAHAHSDHAPEHHSGYKRMRWMRLGEHPAYPEGARKQLRSGGMSIVKQQGMEVLGVDLSPSMSVKD